MEGKRRKGNLGVASFDAVKGLADLEIDFDSRRVTMHGVPVDLRAMEYDLLAFFVLHPHQLFSRRELLEFVWHSDAEWQQESTVTEHVYRVRTKITRPGERNAIVTIRGGGYRYDPPARGDGGDEISRKGSPAPVLEQNLFAKGEYVVITMLRALLRIGSAEDAASLLQLSVQQLGGTVLAAEDAGANALSVDVTLGVGAPMLAVAEPDSVARMQLDCFLPALAEDARDAVNLLRRTLQPEEDSTRVPLTGLTNRRVLHRIDALASGEATISDLDKSVLRRPSSR